MRQAEVAKELKKNLKNDIPDFIKGNSSRVVKIKLFQNAHLSHQKSGIQILTNALVYFVIKMQLVVSYLYLKAVIVYLIY